MSVSVDICHQTFSKLLLLQVFLWFSRNFGHTWFIGQYVKKTVKHILEILILKFLANFFWNFKFVLKSLEQQQRSYLGQQSSLVCFLSQFDLNLKADIVEYEERHSVWNMILFRNEHSTHIQIINILSYNITKSKQKLGLPLFCEIKFKDFQEILWPSNFQGPTGITDYKLWNVDLGKELRRPVWWTK